MHRVLKIGFAVLLVLVLTTGGIFLPEWMSVYTDRSIIGSVFSEPAGAVEADPYTGTGEDMKTLSDTMLLLADTLQDAVLVPLDRGVHYDTDTLMEKFDEEINRLIELKLFPIDQWERNQKNLMASQTQNSLKEYRTESFYASASLMIRKDAPSENALLWSVMVRTTAFFGSFIVDDNSGKIIEYYASFSENVEPLNTETAARWAEYLGFAVKDTEIQTDMRFWRDGTSEIRGDTISLTLLPEKQEIPYTIYRFHNGYVFGNLNEYINKRFEYTTVRTEP